MKIPLEWLNEYVSIKDKDAKQLAAAFTSLGLMLDKPVFEYKNGDYKTEVLDLEHRMDRSDWLSLMGCARDLAAFMGEKLTYPKIHTEKGKSPENKVKIEAKCPELVNRFNTRVFKNIKVKASPDWLKNRLEAYGIPSINNIVDITNYVMVEYGQTMHAQDLSKMGAREIVIRKAKNGEKIKTLLGEITELTSDQFVLSQNDTATVIGGIVGGEATGVDETTTEIILDAGNYNQTNIRKSSRALKIQNESVLRNDKFLHPELTQKAIERATYLILDIAGGEYYENEDWYPNPSKKETMKVTFARVKKIGGMDLEKNLIKNILENLEYKIIVESADGFEVEVPYFRTDVVVEDDIISDIYRINDYTKIPVIKIDAAPPKEITPPIYKFENRLRDIMVGLGFHEHITDPLVEKDDSLKSQVILANALSPEKSALRTEVRTTLKKVLSTYKKGGVQIVKLFEIGRIYEVNGNKEKYASYKETRVLEVMFKSFQASTYDSAKKVKSILASLFFSIGITEYKFEKQAKGVAIIINKEPVGFLDVQGFSLETERLLSRQSLPKRVGDLDGSVTIENLSLVTSIGTSFGDALTAIKDYSAQIAEASVVEEYTGKEVGENKKAVLVEVKYKTSDTQKIREGLLKKLKSDFGLEYRA